MAYEYPAYCQARTSNELRKNGVLVSSGGDRSIWLRHGLETFKKCLHLQEEKAAKEGIVSTEAQLTALETAKRERESHPDEWNRNATSGLYHQPWLSILNAVQRKMKPDEL